MIVMRSLFLIILGLSIAVTPCVAAEPAKIINAAVHLQSIDIDLDMAGAVRETRIYTLGFSFREQLSSNIDGAILIGYLDVNQRTNPILAAQNSSGGFLGFDLRGHLFDTDKFDLYSRFAYRYAQTTSSQDGQKIDWEWHEVNLSIDSQTYISNSLSANLSISYTDLHGQEKAFGNLNQGLDFDQIDSLTAHIGLQLNLDQNGQIVFELLTGSLQGGKIIFMRDF